MSSAGDFWKDPPWWVRDIFVGVLLAAVVAGVGVWVQNSIDASVRHQSELSQNRMYVLSQSADRNVNASFGGFDLSDQSLIWLHLQGALLREANLSRARLADSDLRGADLWDANLDQAVFEGTHLDGAQLGHQGLSPVGDLPAATFRGAHLRHAKIMGLVITDLMGADLTGALLIGTDLTRVLPADLEDAKQTGRLDGICYEDISWPDGFTPPASQPIERCSRAWSADFDRFTAGPVPLETADAASS